MRKVLALTALNVSIFVTALSAQDLLLFGGEGHDDFLGCLNCDQYSGEAICNELGSFGNSFRSSSIFNGFGPYGNSFNQSSPWNQFSRSTSVPVVVDRDGNFYGYFTINAFRRDAVSFSPDLAKLFEISGGNLDVMQRLMCQQ